MISPRMTELIRRTCRVPHPCRTRRLLGDAEG
jgi:hypothetical protein